MASVCGRMVVAEEDDGLDPWVHPLCGVVRQALRDARQTHKLHLNFEARRWLADDAEDLLVAADGRFSINCVPGNHHAGAIRRGDGAHGADGAERALTTGLPS